MIDPDKTIGTCLGDKHSISQSMPACDVFFSLRFNATGPMNEAKALQSELGKIGINAVIINVLDGDNIKEMVIDMLDQCKLAVLFATVDYGAKGSVDFSTKEELEFILAEKKPFFLIKMCDRYETASTRFNLPASISCTFWQIGRPMPADLVSKVAIKLQQVSVSSTGMELSPIPEGRPRQPSIANKSATEALGLRISESRKLFSDDAPVAEGRARQPSITSKPASEALGLRVSESRKLFQETSPTVGPDDAVLRSSILQKTAAVAEDALARMRAAEEELAKMKISQKAAEEASLKKVAEEAAARKLAEDLLAKKAADEAAAKKAADDAMARLKSAEEILAKKAADEAAAKKAADEAAAKKAADEAAAKKAADEAAAKKAADEAAAKKAADEAAAKKAADEAAAKKAADAAAAKKAADEAAAKKAADAAAAKKAADEAAAKKVSNVIAQCPKQHNLLMLTKSPYSAGIVCNVCQSAVDKFGNESIVGHCSECQFDACSYCFGYKLTKSSTGSTSCKSNHPLIMLTTWPTTYGPNDRISCDLCGKSGIMPSNSEIIGHCSVCRFDACNSCFGYKVAKKLKPSVSHCSKNHLLVKMTTTPPNYSGNPLCDVCGTKNLKPTDTEFIGHCASCKFDACNLCFQVKDGTQSVSSTITTSTTSARYHPGRIGAAPNGIARTDKQQIFWSDSVSPSKGYTWDNFKTGWRDPIAEVYRPRDDNKCTWTCCGGLYDSAPCAAMPTTATKPAPVNDEGRVVKLSPADAKHYYCGLASFRCGKNCVGCGPTNGCQCPSCVRWSKANGKPVNDYHPADTPSRYHPGRIGAASNGIDRTDGKEICWSRYVTSSNTNGYTWDNFKTGWRDPIAEVYRPNDSNKCTWTCCGGLYDSAPCAATPTTATKPAPVNDEGRVVKLSPADAKHYYCGLASFRCGKNCVGCGPTNGCQCPSCVRWSKANGKPVNDYHAADASGRYHPGRIGAAPNGIDRTDGKEIVWSKLVNSSRGYTWDNFKTGWRDPISKVYRPLNDDKCTWTCCGGLYDSAPCAATPTTATKPAPVNDEGRVVKLSPADAKHYYCGLASFRCGKNCVGCGPTNGCQCPSCVRWSKANGKPVNDYHPADTPSRYHPGRIGAAPNGIARIDKKEILWSDSVSPSRGYTWDNFKTGWRDPIAQVYRPLDNNKCTWTCCGGLYNSAPCATMPTKPAGQR